MRICHLLVQVILLSKIGCSPSLPVEVDATTWEADGRAREFRMDPDDINQQTLIISVTVSPPPPSYSGETALLYYISHRLTWCSRVDEVVMSRPSWILVVGWVIVARSGSVEVITVVIPRRLRLEMHWQAVT